MNAMRKWAARVAVGGVLCAGVLSWSSLSTVAAGEQEPAEISRAERDAILELLRECHLGRNELIGLNASQAQTEAIIGEAREWLEANTESLNTRRSAIKAARVAVRAIKKAIRMGPANHEHEGQSAAAQANLAAALAAYDSLLANLEGDLRGELDESQQSRLTVLARRSGSPMPFALLDLTIEQQHALARADRRLRLESAAATDAAGRQAALQRWEATVEETLTANQEEQVNAYYANAGSASAAVDAAFESGMSTASDG